MDQLSRRQAIGVLGAVSVLGMPALRPTHARAAAAAQTCFTIYDSTFYETSRADPDEPEDDPDVSAYLGVQESTTIYCDGWYDDSFINGRPPPEDQFRRALTAANGRPGPVVLNCESIFLKDYDDPPGSKRPDMDTRVKIWNQMLDWTHDVFPAKTIGAYAFGESTRDAYFDKARGPVERMDAFFPETYTNSRKDKDLSDPVHLNDIYNAWVLHATSNIADTTRLEQYLYPGQPLRDKYAYLWPNFYGGDHDKTFIPASLWRRELEWLRDPARNRVDGVVLWSSKYTPDIDDTAWLAETKDFILDHPCG